jgi:hypothetical protein
MNIDIFENNLDDLLVFLKEKGNPFDGFILLFEAMIQLARNFEYSPFQEKIESFENALYFQRIIKGILDLEEFKEE